MATIVAAAGGGSWTTGGTWVGGVAPTAADDAVLNGTSGNVTISTGAVCRSLDCTGYTGTLTHTAAVTLTIGDATAGAGNSALKLVAGMTYTLGNAATSAITFASTSTTQQTITTGGKVLGNVTWNGVGGKWQLADSFTATGGTLTLTSGTLDTNGQTVAASKFFSTGSTTRTLTLGASSLTFDFAGTSWDTTTTTNLTFNPGTSTITLSGSAGIFSSGTLTFANVNLPGPAGFSLPTANCTFANLTRTATATANCSVSLRANYTITGTLTLNGNSAVNRLIVQSNIGGTPHTFTAAALSASYLDCSDITAAGTANWNLASITGNSGDCGGNTGITFTTPATQTWSGTSGGAWSANAWSGRIPLPQDDVIINAAFSASQTITVDVPRMGRNVDFTGATGTPTLVNSGAFGSTNFGSLTFISGMNVTFSGGHVFGGRGGSFTITSAGKNFAPNMTIIAPTGTYNLNDNYSGSNSFTVITGTLNTNDFTISCGAISVTSGTINFGASTVNLNSTTNGVLLITKSAGATVTCGAATFNVATATANSRTFSISTTTGFNTATFNYTIAGSTGPLVLSGNMTLGTLNFSDASNARTLTITSSNTITIANTFNVRGTAGKLMTINATTPGTFATLTKTSGVVSCDYLSVQDSHAGGGASWYAGANSTNVSGNTGWFFTAANNGAFFEFC